MAAVEALSSHFEEAPVSGGDLSHDVMADLSHYGLIEVRGEDGRKFLASLFTGDVRQVSSKQGQFTAWCDAKGRVLATFWLFVHEGAYYLLLPGDRLPPILARLKQFLLRVKATVLDASVSLARLGLSGPTMGSRLAAVLGVSPPVERGETKGFGGGCTLMAIPGNPNPRWLAVGDTETITQLSHALQPTALPVAREAWTLLDTLAGLPQITPALAEEFLPQMLNLEALGGLCFTKGCYPGQEVIARLQYRGQLKRGLSLAYADSGEIPAPGTRLYGDGASENLGTVVSAARHPEGRVALLAVVDTEAKTHDSIYLADSRGVLDFVE